MLQGGSGTLESEEGRLQHSTLTISFLIFAFFSFLALFFSHPLFKDEDRGGGGISAITTPLYTLLLLLWFMVISLLLLPMHSSSS